MPLPKDGQFRDSNKQVVAAIEAKTTIKDGVRTFVENLVKAGNAVADSTTMTADEKVTQLKLAGAALLANFEATWKAITANTPH